MRMLARGELRKRVGGHDRAGRFVQASGAGRRRRGLVHDAVESLRRQRLADHAGRGEETLAGLAADRRRGESRGEAQAARPLLPVKALALPELTTSARARRPLEPRAAPFDRCRGHFERVNTPATLVPGSNSASMTSVRSPVADAGGGCREPHARDWRHIRDDLRGERRDGRWQVDIDIVMRELDPAHPRLSWPYTDADARHKLGAGAGSLAPAPACPGM